MTAPTLAGVYAAAITPLKSDFNLDLDAIAPFLEFLARRGCHGALLLGTTGEGPSFSPAERAALWRAALKVRATHPGFQLLAGTGTPSLTETIDLTRLAFDLGFDAVVVLPPYYYRNATEDGLFSWFKELIAAAVPADGALLGYHFPGVAGIGFSISLLSRLKDAFPRQFAGIKDSSHDEDLARALGKTFGDELTVLTGTDSLLSLALENHASGCITAAANILSPELRNVYDAFVRHAEGGAAQQSVDAQRHILEKYPPFPPALKALVAALYQQPRWPVRPPLVDMPAADADRLLAEIKAQQAALPSD